MNKFLVVCGPTATGKTELALSLAKKFNGELVSADSRQVYRGMDIGTGKDLGDQFIIDNLELIINFKNKKYQLSAYKIKGIKLWMYDVIHPDEEFSVGHYQYLAQQVIGDILKRGKLPIVVGGTGLYIRSLINSIETASVPPNIELRKKFSESSVAKLVDELKKIAPEVYEQMNNSDKNNPRRLIRKIEIANAQIDNPNLFLNESLPNKNILIIGLTAPLAILFNRVNERVEKRVEQGIIKEIKTLLDKGYTWNLPSMSSLGYKEWRDKLLVANRVVPDEEKQKIIVQWKKNEQDYVRRQLTWFRKQKRINWFDINQKKYFEKVVDFVNEWYTKFNGQ